MTGPLEASPGGAKPSTRLSLLTHRGRHSATRSQRHVAEGACRPMSWRDELARLLRGERGTWHAKALRDDVRELTSRGGSRDASIRGARPTFPFSKVRDTMNQSTDLTLGAFAWER
jgi:hypothetical protein